MENGMIQLIVISANGRQELLKVHRSGGFHDPSKVIWDEREHGPIPPEVLSGIGGLSRKGKECSIDSKKAAAQKAAIAEEERSEAEKKSVRKNIRLSLNALDLKRRWSAAECEDALKLVITLMRGD